VKRLSDQTLYEIIEVSVDAPAEEIERACDRAAATYGPGSLATYTLAAPEETALLSSRIEEARAVLLDPSARSRYDERIGVRRASPTPEPEPEPPLEPPPPTPALPPAPTPWPPPAPGPVAADARHVSPGLPVIGPAPVEPAPVAPAEPAPPLEARAVPAVAAPAMSPPAPIQLTVEVHPQVDPASAPPRPVAPILLSKEVAAPLPPVVPEGSAWTGEMLRRVRESRGFTVAQLAERTRVTRHHLENIEHDRFAALPAPVYLRGIIMSLARELRLDGQKVARSYLDRMGSPAEGEPRRT
jgi:hypothetical protein